MNASLNQTRSTRKTLLLVAVMLLAVVGMTYFALRNGPKPPVPIAEIHRQSLELRDGIWYTPGQTNRFTGILLDTYEDGVMKSRSAVSNGMLEGLSQGWWSNNIVQVTEYFSHGVSNGERTKYYPNGQKQSVAMIVNGKLEGGFDRWHENGKLAEHVTLKNGEPDGESLAYHPDGSLKARVHLAQGKVLDQKFWAQGEAAASGPVN